MRKRWTTSCAKWSALASTSSTPGGSRPRAPGSCRKASPPDGSCRFPESREKPTGELAGRSFLRMNTLAAVMLRQVVRIEPGEFVMGEGDGPPRTKEEWRHREWDEAPAHRVKITRGFSLGATEVTNAEYRAFEPGHKGPDGEPV